jgi:glycine/D-amino acid oxidase-like deaminating enzyme
VELPLRVVRPEQHFQRMPPSDDTDAADDADHPSALLDPMGRLLDENSGPDPRTGVPHPVIIDLENEFYTRCDPPHGRTRVGRTDYSHDREVPDPDRLDEAVSADFGTWAESVLRRRLPIYRELPALGAQAAWYTLTPDAQALIGPIEGIEGLFVATGFSGHGFKLAPSVAAGLVQMLLGETVTAFSPSFFDPRRFAGKQLTWGGALGL